MIGGRAPSLADAYRSDANNLNLIRLLLAVAVIASHSYPIAWGLGPGGRLEPLSRLTHGRAEVGAVAVDGFFAISGFLLAASWLRGARVADFAARRFLRIYPGFAVAVLACVFVVGPVSVGGVSRYLRQPHACQLLRYLYFGDFRNGLPGAFAANPMATVADSPLWTIKYEVYCYVLLVGLGVGRLLRPVPVAVVAAACLSSFAGLTALGLHPRFALDPPYLPRLTTFFVGGAALHVWRARVPVNASLFAAAVVLLVATIRTPAWNVLVLPTAGTYALIYLGCLRWAPTNRIGRRHDLSYGVYLYAWPVQQLLLQHGIGRDHPWRLTAATLPIVAAVATLSWLAVERPALRLKPASTARRPRAAGGGGPVVALPQKTTAATVFTAGDGTAPSR